MSALGQKQTSTQVRIMSALPPKADIRIAADYVRPASFDSFAIFAAIRRASSFSKVEACLTFPIDRVRIFHPVSSDRVGIHSKCSSHHPSCCSSHHPSRIHHHPIGTARIFRPVPSNLAGIRSMSDGDVEHRQA